MNRTHGIILSLFVLGASAAYLLLFRAPSKCDIGIVGTVHAKHVSGEGYPLIGFSEIFEDFKPDLVILETSSGALQNDDWTDAPPEMMHLFHLAHSRNITIAPLQSDIFRSNPDEESFHEQIKVIRQELNQKVGPYTFKNVHSAQADQALETYYLKRNEILPKLDPRILREQNMDQQLVQAIGSHEARRVLVFSGFTHRLHLRNATSPFCKVNPTESWIAHFDQVEITPENSTLETWKKTLHQLDEKILTAAPEMLVSLNRKKERLQSFVDRFPTE